MTVTFRLYCGEAGSLQQMLIAETEDGDKETCLISRVGLFQHFLLNRAKKKLIKRLEIKTARTCIEN